MPTSRRSAPHTPPQRTASSAPIAPSPESLASAREAGLRYVTDDSPGIKRQILGRAVRYIGLNGRQIADPATLGRIKRLAIPPAWTDVWICPTANGHIQATGRDARGRKQYRYHSEWASVRDGAKFERVIAFGKALPRIRQRIEGFAEAETGSNESLGCDGSPARDHSGANREQGIREAEPLVRSQYDA